jgi:predicted  nucleic acid-binding Zn-ribbon protein
MEETRFQLVIDFVTLDQSIAHQLQQVQISEQQERNIAVQMQQLLEQEKNLNEQTEQACKKVNFLELELKSVRDKRDAKQRALERTSNSRECIGLYQELEELQASQQKYEQQLLEAWQFQEDFENQNVHEKEKIRTGILFLHEQQTTIQQERDCRLKTISKVQEERDKKALRLDPEWYARYQDMKRSVSNPAVPLKDNNCSACFYSLPSPDLTALDRQRLIQCGECYRFLFKQR